MVFKLKDFRQMHKLYQSELAEILGTTQSLISRMEMRETTSLSAPFYKVLCDKFGKEDVDTFIVGEVSVSGNVNNGNGQQNNGIFEDTAAMEIIKTQAAALSEALRKSTEQNDRLLRLLEKLSEER